MQFLTLVWTLKTCYNRFMDRATRIAALFFFRIEPKCLSLFFVFYISRDARVFSKKGFRKMQLDFVQLKPLIAADIAAGNVPLLLGEPGIGKSSLVRSLGKTFTVHANFLATTEDLTGMRLISNPDKTSSIPYVPAFYPQLAITRAIDEAQKAPNEPVILFLDEINRTTPEVTSALLSLITEREIGDIRLPDNVKIIAAGNDDGNVASLDSASLTRFAIYHTTPNRDLWLSVMADQINPYVKAVVEARDDALLPAKNEDDYDDDDFANSTNPRTLIYTSNWLTNLGLTGKHDYKEIRAYNDIGWRVIQEGLASHLGKTNVALDILTHIVDEVGRLSLIETSRSYFTDDFVEAIQTNGDAAVDDFYPDVEDQLNVAIGIFSKTESAKMPKSVRSILLNSFNSEDGALSHNKFDQVDLIKKLNALIISADATDDIPRLRDYRGLYSQLGHFLRAHALNQFEAYLMHVADTDQKKADVLIDALMNHELGDDVALQIIMVLSGYIDEIRQNSNFDKQYEEFNDAFIAIRRTELTEDCNDLI